MPGNWSISSYVCINYFFKYFWLNQEPGTLIYEVPQSVLDQVSFRVNERGEHKVLHFWLVLRLFKIFFYLDPRVFKTWLGIKKKNPIFHSWEQLNTKVACSSGKNSPFFRMNSNRLWADKERRWRLTLCVSFFIYIGYCNGHIRCM